MIALTHQIQWSEQPGRYMAECQACGWTSTVDHDEAHALRAFEALEAEAAEHLEECK